MSYLTAYQTPKRSLNTDSKVRYGKEPSAWAEPIQNFKFNPQERPTAKVCTQDNHHAQQTVKCKNGSYTSYQASFVSRPVAINKRYLLIGCIVLFFVALCVFEPTLQTNSDADCWRQFKSRNCNMDNPQGSQCITLKNCISGNNVQISLASIGIFSAIGFAFIRFKKIVANILKKIMKIVETVIFEQGLFN